MHSCPSSKFRCEYMEPVLVLLVNAIKKKIASMDPMNFKIHVHLQIIQLLHFSRSLQIMGIQMCRCHRHVLYRAPLIIYKWKLTARKKRLGVQIQLPEKWSGIRKWNIVVRKDTPSKEAEMNLYLFAGKALGFLSSILAQVSTYLLFRLFGSCGLTRKS